MPSDRQPVRFGLFEVNLETGEVRRAGVKVRLQEQPFQVLAALLEKPGEIVTKEELQERIWKDDTFVDFDRSLATAINKVRQALGDSATRPQYIETVPKRGYRFIGNTPGQKVAEGPQEDKRLWITRGGIAAGLLAAAGVLWFVARSDEPMPQALPSVPVPVTALPGREFQPTLSPDGTRVAFSWDGESGENFDIYVKVIGAGDPVRLTSDPAPDVSPTWSSDGRYLFFARQSDQRMVLTQIPALGGRETLLTEIGRPPISWFQTGRQLAFDGVGQQLIFSDRDSADAPFRLYGYAFDTGRRTPLTSPPNTVLGDFFPASSADGRRLVFVRVRRAMSGDVYSVELDADGTAVGEARQVTSLAAGIQDPLLSSDGSEVFFTVRALSVRHLWHADIFDVASAERIGVLADDVGAPMLSADGHRLVFSQSAWQFDIWRIELSAPGIAAGPPQRWIYSTRSDMHADYSPDGAKVAFQSDRSGSGQIWVAEADGSSAERLTSLEPAFAGTPRWSPDGTQIAFDSDADSGLRVYVMEANGSGIRALTGGTLGGNSPRWSRDGEWVYFVGSEQGEERGLWRIHSDGSGPERLVANAQGRPFVSPDGAYVYFTRQSDLYRVSAAGGNEELMLPGVVLGAIAVVPEGIYYTPDTALGQAGSIRFRRFSDSSDLEVWQSDSSAPERYGISPDGRFLSFTQVQDVNSDIMLIERFR